jgi:hypothetical protein
MSVLRKFADVVGRALDPRLPCRDKIQSNPGLSIFPRGLVRDQFVSELGGALAKLSGATETARGRHRRADPGLP